MTVRNHEIVGVSLEELEDDPYPFYKKWRQETPVGFLELLDGWVLSRWDHCDELGKAGDKVDSIDPFVAEFFGPHLLSQMPDAEHARMRAAMDEVLSPRAVRGYIEDLARPVSQEYVAKVRPSGAADAASELLELISSRVIGDVVGMKEVDDTTLQRWFHGLALGVNNFGGDDELNRQAKIAQDEIDAFMEGKIADLTDHPDDSILSHMIHSHTEDGVPRTFEYLISTIRMTILGGLMEPGHAAASSLYGLLTEPDQLAAVAADASLVPAAVHEGLRWIAPFGQSSRRLLVDFEVGGVTIPAGDKVYAVIASANRDEARYDEPDRFNVFRARQPMASFGYGIYFCAGHFVGRELERIALEEVLRLPGIQLDDDRPVIETGFSQRGVTHLPIRWQVR